MTEAHSYLCLRLCCSQRACRLLDCFLFISAFVSFFSVCCCLPPSCCSPLSL